MTSETKSGGLSRNDRLIRSTFLKMLEQNPIEQIRVGDLCRQCEINRSTFYRHYEDLPMLLDSIVKESHRALFDEIICDVDRSESFEDVGYSYIMKVCEITKKNRQLYHLLLFGKTPTCLRELMCRSMYDLYFGAYSEKGRNTPGPEAVLHHQFLVYGIIGMWIFWVAENCRTPKEVVAEAVKAEIQSFYNTMGKL